MTRTNLALVFGVFRGGTTPWLEATVVIPRGIRAGLHPATAVIVGVAGNLVTVTVAAWFGARIRAWWGTRRRRRKNDGSQPGIGKRQQRVERVARRWGLPALAALGPMGLGTQLTALVATGIGTTPRLAFAWIAAGTIVWSIIAAIAAVTGLSLTGVGT